MQLFSFYTGRDKGLIILAPADSKILAQLLLCSDARYPMQFQILKFSQNFKAQYKHIIQMIQFSLALILPQKIKDKSRKKKQSFKDKGLVNNDYN